MNTIYLYISIKITYAVYTYKNKIFELIFSNFSFFSICRSLESNSGLTLLNKVLHLNHLSLNNVS